MTAEERSAPPTPGRKARRIARARLVNVDDKRGALRARNFNLWLHC